MNALFLMLTFEIAHRLARLRQFRDCLQQYVGCVKNDYNQNANLYLEEGNHAPGLRTSINMMLVEARESVLLAGVNPCITYKPQPWEKQMLPQRVDVLDARNLFELHKWDTKVEAVLDFVDQAIGQYDRCSIGPRIRTYFPPFLVFFAVIWILRTVFGGVLALMGVRPSLSQPISVIGSLAATGVPTAQKLICIWEKLRLMLG